MDIHSLATKIVEASPCFVHVNIHVPIKKSTATTNMDCGSNGDAVHEEETSSSPSTLQSDWMGITWKDTQISDGADDNVDVAPLVRALILYWVLLYLSTVAR